MTTDIALILAVDGIANGAIYVLVALGIVLIFSITRVVFVPFGDIAAFTALTLAALQTQRLPGTVWLITVLALITTGVEAIRLIRRREAARIPAFAGLDLALPLIPDGYVLETGEIVHSGAAADLLHDPRVAATYLGGHA